jgi:hypothetical protein
MCSVLQIQWLLYKAEQKNSPRVLMNYALLKKHMHTLKLIAAENSLILAGMRLL